MHWTVPRAHPKPVQCGPRRLPYGPTISSLRYPRLPAYAGQGRARARRERGTVGSGHYCASHGKISCRRALPVLGMRLAEHEMGGPVRGVPGLGHGRRGPRPGARTGGPALAGPGRPAGFPGSAAAVPITEVDASSASARPTGSMSLTGCSAAAWCPAPSSCSPASQASASPPCCSRQARWLPRPARCCTSPARSRPRRCGFALTGSGRSAISSTWPRRPTWPLCSATSTRSVPAC